MIIGISGKLYSGKDTLASCLLHEFDDYGVTFMQKSFTFITESFYCSPF